MAIGSWRTQSRSPCASRACISLIAATAQNAFGTLHLLTTVRSTAISAVAVVKSALERHRLSAATADVRGAAGVSTVAAAVATHTTIAVDSAQAPASKPSDLHGLVCRQGAREGSADGLRVAAMQWLRGVPPAFATESASAATRTIFATGPSHSTASATRDGTAGAASQSEH